MTFRNTEDKHHLALLAIPVILSMLLGFSGDARASSRLPDDIIASERVEPDDRSMGSRGRNESQSQSPPFDTRKKALQEAVAAGDYERFLTLTSDTPFAEIMTEAAFRELVQRYVHEKAGFRMSPYTD